MRRLALATALAACGTEPHAANVSLDGVAPAIDALVGAVKRASLPEIEKIVAEPIAVPLHHAGTLHWVVGAKNRVVGVAADGGIVVWDAKSARPIAQFKSLLHPEHVAIAPDGEHLAICGGAKAELMALGAGTSVIRDANDAIVDCAWFPDGRFAFAAEMFSVFDAKTFTPLVPMHLSSPPTALAIDDTGEVHIALTSGETWVWSGAGGEDPKVVAEAPARRGWIATPRGLVDPRTDKLVAAVPDAIGWFGDQVISMRDDAITLTTFGGILLGHSDAIASIAARGDRLVTSGRDGLAIVWKNSAIQHSYWRGVPLVGAGFVSDAQIAVGDERGVVTLYAIDTGVELNHAQYDGLRCLAVRDGRVAIETTSGKRETLDAALANPQPLATSPCAPPGIQAGDWKITGDAAGALRLHATTIQVAIARACGILRRFERIDDAGPACS